VVFTSGHCHHLSVECLAIAPTGKSYPILRQEMQEAFRPEQDRGEALHTFFLNDQKESVQRKSRRHRFIGRLLNHNICGWIVTFSLSPATKKK